MGIPSLLGLKKVTIQPYKDDTYSAPQGAPFIASLNPGEYALTYSNEINSNVAPGASSGETMFLRGKPATLSISLVFDGTGATGGGALVALPVADQVKAFRALLTYQGAIHKPPLLTVVWDDLLFGGFLTQATERYTLFDRDGTPLRARVEASFMAAVNPAQAAAADRTSSPDVFRVHQVAAGDRLDLLANDLYGSVDYWWMVARANRLANPRALRPGRRLSLPRLKGGHGE